MLRQNGVDLPFKAVICPRLVKSIEINDRASVNMTVERTLVFLRLPEEGELIDVIPLLEDADRRILQSPDSDVHLKRKGTKSTRIYWTPREAIVPYGLYVHTYGWSSAVVPSETVYTELHCDMRIGIAVLDVKGPRPFETAVMFRWPRWRRLGSVESLVKHALGHLQASNAERPQILDDGSRLRWTLTAPRVGERYACVAFHHGGVALWQNRIAENRLRARVRRLVRSVTSF
jgi:hypothetical protein